MKTNLFILLGLAAMIMTGCSKPVGTTPDEKREFAQKMRDVTIEELYKKKPQTREKIASGAGYGVFSNINIHLFLLSSGNGYGVVRNNATGDDVFMRMQLLGAGLGIGAKDFRAVIIFKTPQALDTFTNKGWEWGGHADAAAKSQEKGAAATTAGDITKDIEIYQFIESGVALQATLSGTKYWKDKKLN